MTNALGSGDRRVMDVYLVWRIRGVDLEEIDALGAASLANVENERFPFSGVVMRYDVLAGGGLRSFDLGYTLSHEAGHDDDSIQSVRCLIFDSCRRRKWLGLYHTFQSDFDGNNNTTCNPADRNDFIDDTPQQANSSLFVNCTLYLTDDTMEALDTCPDLPGNDLIFNYMNYVNDDICWAVKGSFTPNQVERMYRHFLLYRDFTTGCEDPDEMEIEIVLLWDENHFTDNWIRLIEEESGFVVWNSNTDYDGRYAFRIHQSTMIDLCVPKTSAYVLDVYDKFADGFTNGVITVYRDGTLLQTLEGAFDRNTQLRIERLATMSPTGTPTVSPSTTPSQKPTTFQPTEEVRTSRPTQPTSKDILAPSSDAQSTMRPGQRLTLLGTIFFIFALDCYFA
eukprot:scaffold2193_cov171-Amphora_coffeaeformis.AAC.23